VLGLLAAVGAHRVAKLLVGKRVPLGQTFAWVVTLGVAASAFFCRPPFPTMDDLDARRRNNPVLEYARKDPSFFRLASYQDEDQNWTWEHQTVPEGIPLLMGYARLWHNDVLLSDFTASVGRPQFPFMPLPTGITPQ